MTATGAKITTPAQRRERSLRTFRQFRDGAYDPLHALVLVAPLVAFFEVMALLAHDAAAPQGGLAAQRIIDTLFASFGVVGRCLPGLALLATLLAWHALARRAWRVRPRAAALMLVESVLAALPLLVLSRVLSAGPQAGEAGLTTTRLAAALGGAVYEELVFRLYAVWALLLVFNLCRVARRPATIAAALLAGIFFAWCHIRPVGPESLVWTTFLMRSVAGTYLAVILLRRGFGVAAGCHAAYNVMLLLTDPLVAQA